MSEAKKLDTGKNRLDLLSVPALLAIGDVLTYGAGKYDPHNWRNGFSWSRLIGATLRHFLAWMSGEDKDPETGLSHLAHAGCNIMFLLEHEIRQLGKDDRYRTGEPGTEYVPTYNKTLEDGYAYKLKHQDAWVRVHTSNICPEYLSFESGRGMFQVRPDGRVPGYSHLDLDLSTKRLSVPEDGELL